MKYGRGACNVAKSKCINAFGVSVRCLTMLGMANVSYASILARAEVKDSFESVLLAY